MLLGTLMGHVYIPESLASYPISINIPMCYLAASCITCKGLTHRLAITVKDLIPVLCICSCYSKDGNRNSHTNLKTPTIPPLFCFLNGKIFLKK